jgi:hypothetical protein
VFQIFSVRVVACLIDTPRKYVAHIFPACCSNKQQRVQKKLALAASLFNTFSVRCCSSNTQRKLVRDFFCTQRCFVEQRSEKICRSYFLCVLFIEATTRTEKISSSRIVVRHFLCALLLEQNTEKTGSRFFLYATLLR